MLAPSVRLRGQLWLHIADLHQSEEVRAKSHRHGFVSEGERAAGGGCQISRGVG